MDWRDFHERHNGLAVDSKCWEECGSYCCNLQRVLGGAFFIEKCSPLLFLPGEYDFMKENHLLEEGFIKSHKRLRLKIKDVEFTIDTVNCSLNGKCLNHQFRPVICKAYPLLPVVQIDGRIIGFEVLAPYDMFWEHLHEDGKPLANPCVLLSRFTLTSINQAMSLYVDLLKYPINIFYLMLANIYKKHLLKEMLAKLHDELNKGAEPFFRKYIMLLINENVGVKEALREAEELFDKFGKHWGDGWHTTV